jgi:starch phosphorylase
VEEPDNWLCRPDPWEIARPGKVYPVQLAASIELQGSAIRVIPNRPSTLLEVSPMIVPSSATGQAAPTPCAYGQPAAPASFDFAEFSRVTSSASC